MMRVVEPDRLTRDAAGVLEAVADDVVVIGATAVRIVLSGTAALVAATRDVDAGVAAPDAIPRVVRHLEREVGMRRSELPHERSFTWVRNDLKVQLLRGFFPFARPPAKGLPVNTMLGEAVEHREAVAFVDAPQRRRLWVASPAALVGLKREAFGRTRPGGGPVARDYSDVVLLLEHRIDQIAAQCTGDGVARQRVLAAIEVLARTGHTGRPSTSAPVCSRRGIPRKNSSRASSTGCVPTSLPGAVNRTSSCSTSHRQSSRPLRGPSGRR